MELIATPSYLTTAEMMDAYFICMVGPNCFEEIFKYRKWRNAMQEEINIIERNKTLGLVKKTTKYKARLHNARRFCQVVLFEVISEHDDFFNNLKLIIMCYAIIDRINIEYNTL